MTEKHYWWFKLKENFFKDKEMKKLRKIAGGATYTIIYLKLQLLSLQHDGKLFFEGIEDSFPEEMALELDEEVEDVKMTLNYLQRCGLIEETGVNEFLLTQTVECIGGETQGASRVRRFRDNKKALLGNTTVTKCNTEIEIEKEIELEKDLEIELDTEKDIQSGKPEYKSIIDYLNEKAGTSYKTSSAKTKTLIDARLKEGFTENDFYTVIDKKCVDWIGGDMEKFLRPETLFSNKFEGYLNQKVTRQKTALEMLDELYE